MRVRALIAVLLGLSLALLPAAASVTAPAAAKAPLAASADCDHHAHGHALPEKSPPVGDHCLAMVYCGLCCVTLTGVGMVLLSHDAGVGAAIEPIHPSGPSLSWLTTPPLRPPRV